MIPEKKVSGTTPPSPSLHPPYTLPTIPWVGFDTPQADPAQKLVKIRSFRVGGGGRGLTNILTSYPKWSRYAIDRNFTTIRRTENEHIIRFNVFNRSLIQIDPCIA